ncbi:response regulator [Sandaracinus amylolyticus]|uniref:DNA-binding response regulator, LuxR family n=1 Tax=Sandaracinus amylolyticus TaxID=927083 RepID=A0A0F6W3S5_9BACT|nr:response regulator [Sandaracinus amylolyticus]AKF06725.1 DNA-binding response regulator, LuxR family [Sandaracinus amylolyticus]
MGSESSRPTPLGVARARFVDGLPRKAGELRGSIALLAATPAEERPREELRRRLHALYASAQVFQIAPLTNALKDAIARLDRARDEKRALEGADLDALASLAATLPLLGQAEPTPDVHGDEEPADVEIPAAPRVPRAPAPRRNTLELAGAATQPPPSDSEAPPARESERPRPLRERATTLRGLPTATDVESPTPILITPRSSPPPPVAVPAPPPARAVQNVLSILVVDAAEWQARARAVLPAERFEVLGAADPEEALRLARSSAPDAVLVDHTVLSRTGVDLVRRLRDDPLTDFVPVIALAPASATVDPIALRERGADEVLLKPFDATALETTLARLTGEGGRGVAGLAGEHTIEEVASRIADEVKRGLVESADRGRDLRVPLGDGAEVLAAAWSAIGRVRAHLAQRSGGRLHFRDDRAPGGPAFLALVDEEDTPEPKSAPVSLRDRHAIVVDDDPAVVWFFAGLLREEGVVVDEASDGAEALDIARRRRPDLVVSDILMPRLDGFALTRELKRDPALADVPVILLSWKEDFLQRMRELQSGASGYLRKESGAQQILECVRDVLRPRARLEAQLRAGGDVRGRLERIGILPLIQTAAQHRPDARITVRDAWNLFEIDLRAGNLVDLTRTASDGSFSRGPRVLVPLLGATAGRFAIADAEGPVRASIKEPLDAVLRKGAAAIGALVDAVSGKGLALAAHVELDDDVLASLLRASPDALRAMVAKLRGPGGPRALLTEGSVAPHELESAMLDLARQGAILAVRGPDGEDRIAAAGAARGEIELPMRTPSLVPGEGASTLAPPSLPSAPPDVAAAMVEDESSGPELSWLSSEETTGEIVAEAHRMASEPPKPSAGMLELDAPEIDPFARKKQEETSLEALSASLPEPEPEPERPAATAAPEPPPEPPPAAEPKPPAPLMPPPSTPVKKPAPAAAAAPSESGGMGWFGWAILLAVLAFAGFVAYRNLIAGPVADSTPETSADADAEAPPEATPVAPATASAPTREPTAAEPTTPDSTAPEPATPATQVRSYGEDLAGIDPALGVEATPDQGVVLVTPLEGGAPLRVRIGDRELSVGADPVALALPEGVHEITFLRGDGSSFRFVHVAPGRTRRVAAP